MEEGLKRGVKYARTEASHAGGPGHCGASTIPAASGLVTSPSGALGTWRERECRFPKGKPASAASSCRLLGGDGHTAAAQRSVGGQVTRGVACGMLGRETCLHERHLITTPSLCPWLGPIDIS